MVDKLIEVVRCSAIVKRTCKKRRDVAYGRDKT